MRILLAEDDNSLRDTLTEALRMQGYDVTAVANGQAAVEAIGAGEPFDAAVLDVLLPKVMGVEVGKNLRQNSPRTAVLLISGMYKSGGQQQDLIQQTAAKGFLVKPFEISRLIDTLRPLAAPPSPRTLARTPTGSAGSTGGGAPAQSGPPIPPEGQLLETPPMYLGWRIQREQHTGVLELFGATERARIFAYRGRAVFAQHSDPLLHVGIELLKEGTITPEQLKEASELAVSRSLGIYDVFKGEGMATESQLKLAYKGLVPKIIERTAAMSGRYRWTTNDGFTAIVPSASSGIVDAMLSGVGRAADKDLEPHVAPRRPLRLAPGESWPEVAGLLQAALGSDSLTRAINGRATIAQLLEVAPTPRERTARLRQVYVLMSTMAVQASLEPISMARPAAQPAAVEAVEAPPVTTPQQSTQAQSTSQRAPSMKFDAGAAAQADAGLRFTAADEEARQKIAAKYAELRGKNHWEALGVEQKADAATLKRAYFALSRDFHPDSFAGLQLGSAQRQLEDVFSIIQEAYAVLTDADKRGEYEAKISLEAGGGSTDIGAIFAAESDFNRIKNLVERGDLTSPLKLIGKVAQVLASSEEARGYKLFLEWWQSKNTTTAEATVKELQQLHKAAPAAHSLQEFQGWIYLEVGNFKSARLAFKRVLESDARSGGADRGMRAVLRKIEEQEKASSSPLGKLFKR